MRSARRSIRSGSLLILAASLCFGWPAASVAASDLDAAKAAGWVGERPDGYVGLVPSSNPPSSARALVDDINQRRRAHYQEIAKREGTDVDVVAALAGKKLIARTPAGQYVMDATGQWVMR